jgi:carbon-monoxide dehydrogenase medium subunit
MRAFQYSEPTTLREAVALLQRDAGRASLIAGGTDLLVQIKEHVRQPDHVINIKKIAGLDDLSFNPASGLRIGALTTTRAIETSAITRKHYASLARATTDFASIQVRNRATVVGNVCRASPSADSLPPLIADGACLYIYGPDGDRIEDMEHFFIAPGRTTLARDEIVTHIVVPPPPPHTGKVYIKHGRRIAMELATVGVAVTLTMEGDYCRDIRIALAAVAPTPMRARRAETLLRGARLNPDLVAAAALAAREEARPISDVRGSDAYRRQMVAILTRRAIDQAMQEAV